MARPTKLTPEIQARIVALLRAGNYMETAAAAAGISKQTLYDWLKRGARTKSGQFRGFLDAVEKATAEAEARMVAIIAKASEKQWQAAAWHLERTKPERYGRHERVEMSGRDGGPIQHQLESGEGLLVYLKKLEGSGK